MLPIGKGLLLLPVVISVIAASSYVEETENLSDLQVQAVKSAVAFENILQAVADSSFMERQNNCSEDIQKYLLGVQNGEEWAMRMLDASSKLQSGLLEGNLVDVGMYDECVGVQPTENVTDVQGRHCMINLGISSLTSLSRVQKSLNQVKKFVVTETTLPMLTSSVCLPASCNAEDVLQFMQNALGQIPIISQVGLTVTGATCSKVEAGPYNVGEIVTMSVLLVIVLVMAMCTICDIVKRISKYQGSTTLDTICAFSMYTNGLKILSTKVSSDTLTAVHGIRFLSIAWIVLGHEFVIGLAKPIVNLVGVLDWMSSWESFYLITGPFAVDTFFTLSGFFMSYVFLREMAKGKSFNIFTYYIHRYIRLTPSVAVLMVLVIYVLPHVGSGPRWEYVMNFYESRCRDNWWSNLLYVQNYVHKQNMCLGHSWYLAVDMQLFIISPMILYPLARWPKIGLTVLALFFAASFITMATLGAINGYTISLMPGDKGVAEIIAEFEKSYITTHIRASPWLVGVLLGYIMVHKKLRLNKVQIAVGWIISMCAFALGGFASSFVLSKNYEYNAVWETISFTISRPIWAAGIGWMIFACTQGYGGPLNAFLSFPLFYPLSRLSYCIYLVHFVIQLMKAGAVRTPVYFSDLTFLDFYWSNLIATIAVAFVYSLLFESPIAVLEKLLRNGKRKEHSKPKDEHVEVDAERGIDNKAVIDTP